MAVRKVYRERETGAVDHPIRVLRERLGLSQGELAEMLGCSREALNRWERGKRAPGKEAREDLAVAFGVKVETLNRRIREWDR